SANHTPHHEHLPAVSAVGKLFADNNCTAERNGHQVSPSKPRPGARTAGLTKIGNLQVKQEKQATAVEGSPCRRFATLEAFVAGAGNRLAFASAQTAVERPGVMNPLLVYGPHGTGKTHLLEGIWSAARRQQPNLNCVYLSAEQFTTFYVG